MKDSKSERKRVAEQITPGSDRAVRLGCICPVLDNNTGIYPPRTGWITFVTCPIHGDDIEGRLDHWQELFG